MVRPAASIDRLTRTIIPSHASIAEAIAQLERAGTGALLLCDKERILRGLLTDGDLRRAILRGIPFDKPCSDIANPEPIVAIGIREAADALSLMDHAREFLLNHLPVVDDLGRVVDLVLRSDFVSEEKLGLSAVIMAGGFGSRLRPLTDDVPKPMLTVGDRPLLELTIERLKDAGIKRVNLTTHYLAESISDHFGDGQAFDVDIRYVHEDRPLGTAGGLKLLEESNETLLVINGDIVTEVDFRSMLSYHREHGADVTVGVRQYELQVPYGVIDCDGSRVRKVEEKPVLHFLVNAGIYLLEPTVYRYIPSGLRFDMTDLIGRLIEKGRHVVSFPIVEYWLDIGQRADYERAQEYARNGGLQA
ncbi:MAG: nucleotidyltransferase family protein [Pyrinomonadaceae bacterium]|nr:nucleotidyltransferase family protein [Pyrinomonadaceae bacterium]